MRTTQNDFSAECQALRFDPDVLLQEKSIPICMACPWCVLCDRKQTWSGKV